MLEYVQGFHLTNLEEFAPKAAWQQICDEAIRIINRIGDRDIRKRRCQDKELHHTNRSKYRPVQGLYDGLWSLRFA